MEELIRRLCTWYQEELITQACSGLSDGQHIALRHLLVTWFHERLSAQGNEEQKIKQEYRKLALVFHPDKLQNLDEAILLANRLMANDSQSPLFACLLYTKELLLQRLINNAAEQAQHHRSKRDFFQDMLQRLQKSAEKTRFEGKRQVLLQAIDMLRAYQKHTEEERYKEAAVTLISKGFPFAVTAFCVMSYMPQCLALLAVTKLAHHGGDYIRNLGGARAQYVGDTLRNTSDALQKAGLGLFSAVIAGYLQSLHLSGNAIKQLWLIENTPNKGQIVFQNEAIEKIVIPLVVYLDEVKAQWGLPFRKGAEKQQLVANALEKIKLLDSRADAGWPLKLKDILDELASSNLIRSKKGLCAMRIAETLNRFGHYAPETQEHMALVLR